MDWGAIWHRLTTTRYTQALEWEVERLRDENRSMLNSLLTRAGVQPIDVPQPISRTTHNRSRYQRQVELERKWIAKQPNEQPKTTA